MVDTLPIMIVALNRIAMSNPGLFIDSNPPASFPALSLLIQFIHDFVTEIAFIEVKVNTVHRNQLCKSHCLHLLFLRKAVSKHENPFLWSVCMEVHKHEQVLVVALLHQYVFQAFYRWMELHTWTQIASIQIGSFCVWSIVASIDPVWIEGRNDFEDIILQKASGLSVRLVHEQVKKTIKHVRSPCFSWMDSGADHDHFLVIESKRSLPFFRKQISEVLLIIPLVRRQPICWAHS